MTPASFKKVGAILTIAAVTGAASPLAQTSRPRWIATWTTAIVGRPQTPPLLGPPAPPPFMPSACPAPTAPPAAPPAGQTFGPQPFVHLTNQTIRQIVHTSLGGSRARLVLSNSFGTAPLTIGAAHVALRSSGDSIQPGSGHALTFSGRPTVTIPARAVAYSDPVPLAVPALGDLAVDVYLPGTTDTASPTSFHNAAAQTNYISETGNHAGAAKLPTVGTLRSWFAVARVEIDDASAAGVVVAFGDSITDGTASTPDSNTRWPDFLARRLQAQGARVAVVNQGIGGNRVLSEGTYSQGMNALARFEQDVLSQPGVTHVIVLEGINDIGNARQNPVPTAEDLIAAHRQLIERAHTRGLKIIGATLTPFWGANYYTEAGEAKRQALNQWIRTGKAYDGVIDFDKATQDPADAKKFLAAYDSCDHLHPNSDGYKAMGDAIDLALFRSDKS